MAIQCVAPTYVVVLLPFTTWPCTSGPVAPLVTRELFTELDPAVWTVPSESIISRTIPSSRFSLADMPLAGRFLSGLGA
jgi:hypothetical protein